MTIYAFWFIGGSQPAIELGAVDAESTEQAVRMLVDRDEKECIAIEKRRRGRCRKEKRLDASKIEARPLKIDDRQHAMAMTMHDEAIVINRDVINEEKITGRSLRGDGGGWLED